MSPRKVRLIADMIRGKKAVKAVEILSLLPKRAALPVLKLLKSAIVNAKHNFSLNVENLRVEKIIVDGGPVLKRWKPRARGRATPIRKRTSHILLVLTQFESKEKKAIDKYRKTPAHCVPRLLIL